MTFNDIERGQTISKSIAPRYILKVSVPSIPQSHFITPSEPLTIGRLPNQECQAKDARVSHGIPSNIKQ